MEGPTADANDLSSLSDHEQIANGPVYLLFGDIDCETARDCVAWILNKNLQTDRCSMLNLFVCSQGGELNPAFAIIDIMNTSQIPVRTIGLGQIASAGLMIFMNGSPGERILTPYTSIMSHRFSGGSEGKFHELVAVQKEFELTNERMFEHYRRCTNLNDEQIEKYLLPSQDVYMDALTAYEHGLCDEVKDVSRR